MLDLTPLHAKIFFFMATIQQLQNMGYIEEYVEMFSGANTIFHKMMDGSKIELTEEDLDEVLEHTQFAPEDHEKLKKFYRSYHSMAWVKEDTRLQRQEEAVIDGDK